jgi:hypothetical protein
MASELLKNRVLMQRLKEPDVPQVDFGLQSTGFEELFTLPEPKPQELLDIQEDNRKDRLLDSLNKIGGGLMDESLDFIKRQNFGGGGVTKSLGGGLYETTYKKGSKTYYTRIYDRETGKDIKTSFGSDKKAALKSLKKQKADRPPTKFEKGKEVKETKGTKEFKKITDKIDKKFNEVKNKGYTNLREFRKEMQELITKDKFSNVFETKLKLGNYLTDKFIDIEDVNTSKMESALDKYNKVGGKERGTLNKIASEFGVNKQTLEGNIQKTGRKKIPIKYGDIYEKRKAVSEKRAKAVEEFSDPSFESKMSGTKAVQKSHMDDLYSKVVRADTLGYAPEEINQVLLKDVDAYLNSIYEKRNELIKNKPAGYKEAIEEINQKGIAVAQATDGYKSFQIEQPDGKKYQFGVEPGKTIDPTGIVEGKEIKGNVEKVQFEGGKKPTATLTPDPVNQFLFEENRQAVMSAQQQVTKAKIKNIAKQLASFGFKCSAAEGGACDNPMNYLDDIKKQQAIATGSGNAAANAAKKLSAGRVIFREVLGPAALGFELAAAVPITYLGYKAGLPPARIVADATYGLFGETEKARLKKEAVKAGIDTAEIQQALDFEKAYRQAGVTGAQEQDFRGPDDEMLYPQQYEKAFEDLGKEIDRFESPEQYKKYGSQLQQVRDYIAKLDADTAAERASKIAEAGSGGIDDLIIDEPEEQTILPVFDFQEPSTRMDFSEGSPKDPSRRTFLKFMAGIASLPFVGKFFKGAKSAKVVKLANTTTVMPDWFPAFVDNAFKKGIAKKIDADLTEIEIPELPGVKVQAHDDGRIMVEGKNAYNEPYEINYTPPGYEVIDETTGKAVKTPGEFQASDTRFRQTGPELDDVDVDYDTVKDIDDIVGGNSTELEGFAKGTGETKYTKGQKAVDEADARSQYSGQERADFDQGPEIDPTDYYYED